MSIGLYLGWQVGIPQLYPATAEQNLISPAATNNRTRTLPQPTPAPLASAKAPPTSNKKPSSAFQAFEGWLAQATSMPMSQAIIDEGIALAAVRKLEMRALILSHPEQALSQALSLSDYAKLPDAIKPYVEKPFSTRADIMVLPDESGLTPQNTPRFDPNRRSVGEKAYLSIQDTDGKPLALSRYGSRTTVLSKEGIAAQGITLEGVAAIHPAALQIVQADDVEYIQQHFPTRSADTQHDFYTGEAIQGEPILALAGGQAFYFASAANVERLNLKLADLEQQTGPKTGSQILFEPLQTAAFPATSTTSEATPFSTQLTQALAAVNTWTETPKSVFYIRIDFPDKPGDPITKSALDDGMVSTAPARHHSATC